MSIEVSDIEPDCREDRDCPGVSVCRDAICVDPDCIRDDQCADSERCLNGRCEIREDFCARDTDCANPSQICEDETCVSTNGACADRDDCPDESYCIAGGCVAPFVSTITASVVRRAFHFSAAATGSVSRQSRSVSAIRTASKAIVVHLVFASLPRVQSAFVTVIATQASCVKTNDAWLNKTLFD